MTSHLTVRLRAGRTYCSGALISPDLDASPATRTDLVLTCAHFLRGRTGRIHVSGAGVTGHLLGAVTIAATDLAVVRLSAPAPPADLLRVSTSRPPLRARTLTTGYGGRAARPGQRAGRIIARTPLALSRNLSTRVRPAAIVHNHPKVVRGDSGGPVIVDGEIVAVQSLIARFLHLEPGLATVSQVGPHHRALTAAVTALQRAY